ncbi:GumC family protein [Sphingomonas sp. URHD0057]|uniref:GumC family protein n=1 Tax=Sphingomonas sp. URHD0057 TaxID=1380389 RepID=UPI000686A9AE|nr:polysaccharide biosynthesis tyrosine autokinase [Sphingomonas sp. URHD0057]
MNGIIVNGPDGRNELVPVTGYAPNFMRQFEDEHRGDLIDLRDIWLALWRNRYLILVVVAAFLAAGFIVTRLMTPMYMATASVAIDQQQDKVLGTEDSAPAGALQDTDRFLQTQVDILHSRALAARVIDSLNLAANARFLKAMHVEAEPAARRETAIGELLGHLDVELPKNSRVLPISFQSPDPKTAAVIANSYAENFIAANLQRHFDTSTYSKNFLQQQLGITKSRLENSEQAMLAYARAVGIVDTSQGAGFPDGNDRGGAGSPSLTTSNLIQLNQSYAAARSARLQAQERWQAAQATPVMSLPEVLTSPAIQQLEQKRAEVQADYQQQLEHRQPDHPAVKAQAAQLAELDSQIANIAATVKDSIRTQYVTAARQEGALSGAVSQLKGATLSEQTRGIRYNILKREVDTNRQLYDGLLQRYKEVSAEAGVTLNNISIVDLAEPSSSPVSPNLMVNLALAGIVGAVLALLIVLGREMFNDRIRNPDEVERRFGVPILGAVPKLGRRLSPVEALADDRSIITEPYQAVRAAIDLAQAAGPPSSLLISSSQKGEGKSTTALAIARSSAASGRRVLLIDGDMRNPSLHGFLNASLDPGLADVLEGSSHFDDQLVQHTDIENLDLLSAGRPKASPAQLLSGTRFRDLLQQARGRYDQVIIDTPPILGLADTLEMAAVTEQTILVVGCDRAHRRAVKESLKRLTAVRADILGSVLLKFAPRRTFERGLYSYYYYDDEQHASPKLLGWTRRRPDPKDQDDRAQA